jgi:hypothetical protein
MTDDFETRLSLARQGLFFLPPDETRAAHALRILDRYSVGEATRRQLQHAGDACRHGFQSYARQVKQERNTAAKLRCRNWCVAMYAVYDVVDRVLDDRQQPEPTPEPLIVRIVKYIISWLWPTRTPELPEPTPYRTSGRRSA